MSHQHDDDGHQIVQLEAKDIAEVELMEHLKPIESLIFKTALYFFSSERFSQNAPFKGFLLQGTVGTGKTEIVRQVARHLGERLGGKAHTVLVPVDSAVVASPRWGESEQVFQDLFALVKELRSRHDNPKVLLLFDDMESLMIARGMQAAREWHYSLNSVFFHLVDNMNPFQSMVFATTNRADLMDPAITTRLYSIQVPTVPLKELVLHTSKLLDSMLGTNSKKTEVLNDVEQRLSKLAQPTIRDCRQFAIISCVEKGVLSK